MTGDPQETLLLVTLQNVILAGFTIGTFIAGVFVARRFGSSAGYSLSSLGFVRPKGGYLGGVGVGVMVGFGAVLVGALVNYLSISVLERFGYSTESRVQRRLMQGLEGWVRESPELAIPAILLVVVLFGPAVEELVFRGGVFNGLNRLGLWISTRSGAKESRSVVRKVSFVMAALASSGLFALLHLEPVLVASLLILAFVLCTLFEKTGSLLPPFVAHATFNSFAATLIVLSGLDALPVPI
ncbi:MAG: CPBP family intramembrane glutamic endopeptidase [Rubrobacteraceae bacterium]